ncbi:hypothetical protein [Algibacter sp. L4_22]|uniref:hypothetical protein n=1 Tax=Algibacter sp. L4_22 TaxID=2942477 RepID=UPI00201B49A4|nr:hypothetical protein [Algibacter sp. L4_22]MCL5128805.1 hypothetical protein [Algibacter sp. L4_22]
MKKKPLLIISGIILIGFFFYYLGWSLSPGSYSRAETYEFNISEETLIEIINEVKTENKELDAKTYFEDYKNKHWHFFYFQYLDKNQIIHTWSRPKNKTTTTFAFVAYKSRNDVGNWISANKYFWWWKNSEAKNEFETRILKKIEDKIKKSILR